MSLKKLTIAALTAVFATTGCELTDSIQETIENIESTIAQATGVSDESFAVASDMMSDGDTALASMEADEAAEDIQDELAVASSDSFDSLSSLAPGFAPGDRPNRDRKITRECYVNSNCTLGGRLRHLHIEEGFDRGAREGRITNIYFRYSTDSVEAIRGNMNETSRPTNTGEHTYVYADVTVSTQFQGDVADGLLTGWRHWHSDPQDRFLFFRLENNLPDHERAPYRKMVWEGGWDVSSSEPGVFTRTIDFADATQDIRTWEVDERHESGDIILTIDYTRDAPGGLVATGGGEYNLGDTRHCRLDDSGAFTLNRDFPDEETTEAYPKTEVITYTRDNGSTTISGDMTLSDDSVLNRQATRTIVTPETCDDPRLPREIEQTGVTYRGVTVETSIIRDGEATTISSSRQRPEGGRVDLEAVRADGIGDVTIERFDDAGELRARLDLVVDPSGHATGTLTRYLEDGSEEIIDVDRDLRGRIKLKKRGHTGNQFRHINRGEL